MISCGHRGETGSIKQGVPATVARAVALPLHVRPRLFTSSQRLGNSEQISGGQVVAGIMQLAYSLSVQAAGRERHGSSRAGHKRC